MQSLQSFGSRQFWPFGPGGLEQGEVVGATPGVPAAEGAAEAEGKSDDVGSFDPATYSQLHILYIATSINNLQHNDDELDGAR